MGATTIIRRELPHLTPLLIDGFIWTMTPTLTFIVSQMDDKPTKAVLESCVVFLTSLGAWRSKALGDWREGKRQRDETALLTKSSDPKAQILSEGHLR